MVCLALQVATGLGETLASGKRGSAWRLAVNKSTGADCAAVPVAWCMVLICGLVRREVMALSETVPALLGASHLTTPHLRLRCILLP